MQPYLRELMKKYNKRLQRNRDAEKYFKEHTVNECLKYLNGFNTVTRELSQTMIQIENCLGRKLTEQELTEGFTV